MNSLLGGQPYNPQMMQLLGLDPAEMRKQALWQGLTQAGLGLLGMGPSRTPIGFGDYLAAGAKGGIEGAMAGKEAYLQNAVDAWQMQQMADEAAYKKTQQAQENTKFDAWQSDRQQAEDLRAGQRQASEGFLQDWQSQGGDLFPQWQGALRQQGIGGVDPSMTHTAQRMQPYMQAGDYGGAFGQMTAMPEQTKPTDDMREYQFAVSQGYQGSFQQFMIDMKRAGATTIDNRQVGSIPPGYQVDYDQSGNPVSMSPIPGSPAALEAEAAQQAQVRKQAEQATAGDVVVQDIDRALSVMDSATLPTTGFFGEKLSGIGGTAANDISKLVDTVRSNIGFDKLQRMRDNSPTGGALGNVAIPELQMLQAAVGSLEQSQTEEQFRYNLKRVKNIYLDIIHGPNGGPPREPLSGPASSGAAPGGSTSTGVPWSIE